MPEISPTPEYEIWGIRYGTNASRLRGQNFILESRPAEPLVLDFYCWVLKSADRTIIVDTGMNPAKAAKHGHQMLLSLPEAWRSCGIDPDAVDTVVLTHLHYDHTGHLDAFPRAKFWLQAEEMAYVTGPWMEKPWFRRAYEPDEICQVLSLLHEGRLHLHGRDVDIAPGVSAHWVGGHCAGQEILRVNTARGPVVLASDALHYYEEYERGVPFAVAFNLSDMIAAHDRIRQLAASDQHVLPAHDPRIAGLYPERHPGVFRLDVPPAC